MPRYIDADDAIYELKRAFPIDDFGKIVRCISRVPTADVVVRKKGKWISRKNEPKHSGWWTCSECQGRFDYQWKFCPNCGAEMKGENDDPE